jgi:hypothetical protein
MARCGCIPGNPSFMVNRIKKKEKGKGKERERKDWRPG